MRRFTSRVAATLSLAALFASSLAHAQVVAPPNALNFQGRLATPSGNPVANGTYSIRFSLWDALTGGTEKWNKTVANVQVKNGTFAVTLDTFPAGTFNGNLWLETKIGSDAALSLRQPLVSVPYAMKSDLAFTVPDNSITNAKISGVDWSKILNPPTTLLSLPLQRTINSASTAFSITNTGGNGMEISVNNNVALSAYSDHLSSNSIGVDAKGYYGVKAFGSYGVQATGIDIGVKANGLNTGITALGYDAFSGIYGIGIQAEGDPAVRAIGHTYGVYGTGNYGVYGRGSTGVLGETNLAGSGVTGKHDNGNRGILGGNGYGVYGEAPGGGYAGRFAGNVFISDTLTVRTTTYTSDARYKRNIAALPDPLDMLLHLRGVSYEWKQNDYPNMNFANGRQIGFIAQEVEKIFPELVTTDAKGYKSVNYVGVVPVLVEAVKAQQKQRAADRNEVNALKAKNAELDATLKHLAERLSAVEAEQHKQK